MQQSSKMKQQTKSAKTQEFTPSQLIQKQLSGQIFEEAHPKIKIIQFQNLADFSSQPVSSVAIDEPLFDPLPPIIQFTDYEPLQIKEKIFKLRNKDRVARRVKIYKPDSRLFQVIPQGTNGKDAGTGTKVAPGMETTFIIRFSPESKSDYNYDVIVETEREKFVVPIVAVGKRAMIDFPDNLDFGNCPVKYVTEKPVIIRNLGEKTTKWFLQLPQGFDSDKKEGVLEYGKNEQIVVKFYPNEARTYKNKAKLLYDNMEAFVPITGIAHNGNVYLSKSQINMTEAFIGLQLQQTLQIINKSNVKVDFEWRAFATEKEEQEKKNRLRFQLEEEEAEERMLIKELVSNEGVHEELELEEDEDSEEEERDEKAIILKKQKKAELMLGRKYRNIRKAIEDDLLLFQDDIFTIEPIQGQIWPNSEMTVTVTFVPKSAFLYQTIAYCNISCSEERLPLNLYGQGMGPRAFLSVYEVNLGDVFVNEVHKTEVVIENRGEIECKFELMPNERAFGKMFKFDVDRGILAVGQRMPFTITFKSSIPGEFKETFRWKLEGSTDQLNILFIGHVIAPTFNFDVEKINFGIVSYSFQQKQVIRMTNTSTVAFTFELKIPGDGKLTDKEFEIEPRKDSIQPKHYKDITLIFMPRQIKSYEMVMVVDIEGVGQDMLSIPITADCQAPRVELKPSDRLNFNKEDQKVFLRNPCRARIDLINTSDLPAKFFVEQQNDEYKVLADFVVDPQSGEIKKNATISLEVTLTTKKLQDITLPLKINIVGTNNGQPHVITIVAFSEGPKVKASKTEIDFGEQKVLETITRTLTLTNDSDIEADFHAFTKNKISIFKPVQKHGIIKPKESCDIEVLCCPDDAVKVNDVLHFVIKEGDDVEVQLKAKGVGSTLFCKEELTFINLGVSYTYRKVTKEIFVENKGRKPQKLVWTLKKPQQAKDQKEETKNKNAPPPPEEEPVFSIAPESVSLLPKHGIMFQFRGYSQKKGTIQETYLLNSTIGTERKANLLYATAIEAQFIQPTLQFSDKKLKFKYFWEKNVPFMPISQNLDIMCACPIPVNFTLKCQQPFTVNQEQIQLSPGKNTQVRVDFDPSFKSDRKSGDLEGKLVLAHVDHPHKDVIDLIGTLAFPNLILETDLINFGSILNDTTKKMVMTMKNKSEMALHYEWTFVQDELQPIIPINEIFDILPLSGYLDKDGEEQVEFVYNAIGGQRFKTSAICHVDGGPDYEVTLSGDSSLLSYQMSTSLIELGDVRFCEWVSRDFSIENIGKVTFEFKINLQYVKKKGFVDVQPLVGKILGGEKQRITVRVSPVIPAEFKEIILVQIGYFEPQPLTIIGKGVYPSLVIKLPRTENNLFKSKFDQEMAKRKVDLEAQVKRAQLLSKTQNQKISVKTIDQVQLEVERDIDRIVFCEQVKKIILDRQGDERIGSREQKDRYNNVFLANYICDFGNVVLNSLRTMTIALHNMGQLGIEFVLDGKYFKPQGYTIQPERVANLPPGEAITLTVSYQTKKNMGFGPTKTIVPIELKKGPKFQLELLANITIPTITIENSADGIIDFGKVLIGQKKIFFMRLINDKEIDCEWSQSTRQELSAGDKKEEPRFVLVPNCGCIKPGDKQIVEVHFTPLTEKNYSQKFTLNIKENATPYVLNVKGTGSGINLIYTPAMLNIGPILPYDKFSHAVIEIKNPSEFDTELYSLDFDNQYNIDDEMVQMYPPLDHQDFILMPVRQPGQPIWQDMNKAYTRTKRKEEVLQLLEQEQNNEQLQKELEEIIQQENMIKVEYPKKVADEVLKHIVIFGQPKCGKTMLAEYLEQKHKRKVINMPDIVQWNQENQTEAYKNYEQFMSVRQQELQTVQAERDRLLKKAGKKSKDLEDKWGPIPLHVYEYINEDILTQLIKARLRHEDCAAGAIFDNLKSKYWPNELYLLKCIMDTQAALQLIIMQQQFDEYGYEICKQIEWEGMEKLQEDEKKKEEQIEQVPPTSKEKGKVAKKSNVRETKKQEKPQISQLQLPNSKQKSRPKTNQSKRSLEHLSYYEVSYPQIFEDELQLQQYQEMAHKMEQLFKNQYHDKIEIPSKIHDPVFDEGKKEEKPKPLKKGEKPPEPEEPKIEQIDYSHLQKGERKFSMIPLHYNIPQLQRTALELVPEPIYPNPNTLPIPDPIYYQIVSKRKDAQNSSISQPQVSGRKKTEPKQIPIVSNMIKHFSILTPNQMYAKDPKEMTQQAFQEQQDKSKALISEENKPAEAEEQQEHKEQQEQQQQEQQEQQDQQDQLQQSQPNLLNKQQTPQIKARANVTSRSLANMSKRNTKQVQQELLIPLEQKYNFKIDDLQHSKSRWVIPAGKTLVLVVQFFTKCIGTFENKLNFDNFFSIKKSSVDVKGVADFPSLSSLPKQLFWQPRKNRPGNPPESYVSKTYIISEQVFEFGPLLIGKSDKVANRSINSYVVKLANLGKFDSDIYVSLLSQVQENNEVKKGIFSIDQENAKIAMNSVPMDLRVWCFPDKAQKFRDDLIVQIKDNPLPLIIPMQCTGCRPTIDLLDPEVKFKRLLINQQATKTVTIKNTGMINAKWKLTGIENLEEEFQVINTYGELSPTQEAKIEIRFKAINEKKLQLKIQLEVEDIENMNIKQDTKIINVEAEAFKIKVDVIYPQENIIDFGSIKVFDYKDQILKVKNIGIYKVKCSLVLRKKLFNQLFKVEPVDLEIESNQQKDILIRFCGVKEIKMKTTNETTDMFLEVKEGETNELYEPVPINVQFNSVYSKYGINPVKNINFGPIQFNESKSRNLEIKNEGQFEFNFTIFDYGNEEFRKQLIEQQEKEKQEKLALMQTMPSQMAPVDPKKGPKKDDKKQDKKGKPGKNDPPPGQLKIGQWTIMPSIGTIAPDSSCTVEITFTGSGQKNYEQRLAIDVGNRNPEDQPPGILYVMLSESCIPGINTLTYESIFEEQVVLQSQVNNNLSNLIQSNVFFIEEKVFSFGTLVPSKVPDGVVERFKLTNPNKIPCNMKLDVRRRQNYPNDNFAFEVQPKQVKIAPHESIYIKVAFKPTIMAQYFGVFEAIVENGEQSPKTHKLLFDLRGEGALPTLKLEKPKEYLDERTPVVKFGRVRLGKTSTLPIVLKNDGQIPATVKWDLNAINEHFRFLDQNTFSLTPKTSATFNIEFCPKDVGQKQHYFIMQTLLNPYEITKIAVMGESFQEDIVFENVEEEVQFGDCIINIEKKIQFFIKNNGTNIVRFQWNSQGCEDFIFVPRQGHLSPKESKSVTLTFKSNKSVTHKSLAMLCETKQINKKVLTQGDWDDSQSSTRYVTLTEYNWIMKRREEEESKRLAEEASQKKGAKKADKKAGKTEQVQPPQPEPGEEANIPLSEPLPEPEYQAIDKSDKSMPLKVNAIADFAKYEIESREVTFKETLMYTTRVHQLRLKNTSLIGINYQCKIVSAETGAVDPGYFYVFPKNGKIASNSDEIFTLKFSPTEVDESNERLLVIQIDNLDPNLEKLIVELDGQVERPICHFELPPNTYREKKPDLEAKYNVIEFESLGCKVKNTKRFYIVNPTSMGYDYEWKRVEDEKNMNANYFKCITQRGTVLSGKKAEIIFEYTPDTVGQHESYWTFEIPQEHIIQYFFVAGNVVEPNVIFNVGKVNFGPLLVQGKNKEIVFLKNLEDVPLSFQFERDSFYNPEYGDSLTISPIQGVIKPLGDQPIEIQFAPKVEREYNYNLLCHVKRRTRPVTLNVKGIGYILHNNIYLNGIAIVNQTTQVDMGHIYINEKQSRIITVENLGDFNFDYSIRKQSQFQNIIITPENGTVKKNEKSNIEIRFQPTQPQRLNIQIQLQISSGPTYTFILVGSAKKPAVEFSFDNYDFGPCFVLKQPLPITKYLELRNRDVQAMAIEAIYEKKPYFNVQLPSGQVLLPIQIETSKDKKGVIHTKELNVLQIPITFTPREQIKYDESVIFDINGLQKTEVRFTGEGVPLKLDLLKTEHQQVDFGIFNVGQIGTEIISLVNNSQKLITLQFEDTLLKELKKKYFIKIRPKGEFIVNPKERKDISITFKPQQRLHQFKTELHYKIVENNEVRKLLNMSGACYGIELKLMEDTVGFGAVVINSRLTKSVQLSNLGDVAAKFNWDDSFCKNYFTIKPLSGTLPAHEDIHFTITFHPNAIDNDIRFDKVKCHIQNSDSLYLNLSGKCIEQPKEQIQEVKFETVVRTPQSKKISIKNPTPKPWKVKASVQSLLPQFRDYFEGKEYAEIPANATADYEVIYKPLTMTANPQVPNLQETHDGSLFFPLPDGQALLYNLSGKSLPPQPIAIDCNIKAKKNTTQVLPVKNWLKQSQRFEVTWTLEPEEPSLILNGANTFEVSGDGTKDYKLTIYGLKQVQNKVTVYFKNALTLEFVYYKLNVNVQPPDPLPKIELTSIVREIATKLITIENPLNQAIQFTKDQLIAEVDSVSFNPPQFVIPPKSEFGIEIAYRPLIVQDIQSKLSVKSPQLGEFVYPLKLQGIGQNVARSLYFKAPLGSEMVLPFKFTNYTKKPTQYTCYATKLGPNGKPVVMNIDPKAKGAPAQSTDFICEQAQLQAPAAESFDGIDCQVSVRYEPSSLSESRAILIATSPEGGEYQCLLIGQGVTPQPKGPFKLGGGKPPAIEFKNPFFEAQEFTIRIDNPSFTSSVKSPIKIDGKKSLSMNVVYKPVPNTSNNGRLTITCGDLPQWVFYLSGEQ